MFTVYSKPNCTFCDQAKSLLEMKGLPHEIVHLDIGQKKEPEAKYISRDDLLKRIPNARTMPQVVRADNNASVVIGGFTELKKFLHA